MSGQHNHDVARQFTSRCAPSRFPLGQCTRINPQDPGELPPGSLITVPFFKFITLIGASLVAFIVIITFVLSDRNTSPSWGRVVGIASIVVVGGMTFARYTAQYGLPACIYYSIPAATTILLPPIAFAMKRREILTYTILAFFSAPASQSWCLIERYSLGSSPSPSSSSRSSSSGLRCSGVHTVPSSFGAVCLARHRLSGDDASVAASASSVASHPRPEASPKSPKRSILVPLGIGESKFLSSYQA